MAKQKGRLFVLKLALDGTGGTVAGVKVAKMTLNNGLVDITNKDSGGWRELLESSGTQSIDIDIDGIVGDEATFKIFKGYSIAGTINPFQLFGQNADKLAGSFFIENYVETGEEQGAVTFTASLKSSGSTTFTRI
jgi:TP901-1 family phage major tail protein